MNTRREGGSSFKRLENSQPALLDPNFARNRRLSYPRHADQERGRSADRGQDVSVALRHDCEAARGGLRASCSG